jgi:hypothetical protein
VIKIAFHHCQPGFDSLKQGILKRCETTLARQFTPIYVWQTAPFIAPSNPTRRLPSCYAHTTSLARGRRIPRVGGADLWHQMALGDTTVEQSLVSSAEGTRGRKYVRVEDGSPIGGKGWDGGMGEGR